MEQKAIEISGTVFHHEKSVPKKVRRFVARHFEKWAEARFGSVSQEILRIARIRFDRVGRGHSVSCSIRLETSVGAVRGSEVASGLHQSLDACLKRIESQIENFSQISRMVLGPPLALVPA